ncbi:hypothetical protein ACFZDG_26280 [Kitasatospora xanthocidica]|uniref:hypothetical protein n=1 Tax=Kitasatospora xanthocidica TaxID=83382 RepID=UPI0036E99626
MHTYDAQLTVGEPAALPVEVALDGVEENLFNSSFTTSAWPQGRAGVRQRPPAGPQATHPRDSRTLPRPTGEAPELFPSVGPSAPPAPTRGATSRTRAGPGGAQAQR